MFQPRINEFQFKKWMEHLQESKNRNALTVERVREAIDELNEKFEKMSKEDSRYETVSKMVCDVEDVMNLAFSETGFRIYSRTKLNPYLPPEIQRSIYDFASRNVTRHRKFVLTCPPQPLQSLKMTTKHRKKKKKKKQNLCCMMIESRKPEHDTWEYSLFSDESLNEDSEDGKNQNIPPFLLSARRRPKNSIFRDTEYEISIAKGWGAFLLDQNLIAVLRSNALGTRWNLTDQKTGHTLIQVVFEMNLLRNTPVKHKAYIRNVDGTYDVLRTCQARWMNDRYCLNFGGRVKFTSSKNFQMEREKDLSKKDKEEESLPLEVLYQFGRSHEKSSGINKYALDFNNPFCPVTAFALAICHISKKIAC